MPTPHHTRIKAFMRKAGQDTPRDITIPDEDIRRLRAALILEEALETIQALGFSATVDGDGWTLEHNGAVDLEGVVDGCADVSVVTIGTLIAFGVDDDPILEEVDAANLRKFGPGGYRREDGKWMKPPDWAPPDIMGVLDQQADAVDADEAG